MSREARQPWPGQRAPASEGRPPQRRRVPPPGGPPRVVPAEAADLDALSQVIAGAFGQLPASRWLIPSRAARRAVLPGYFRLLAEVAMATG